MASPAVPAARLRLRLQAGGLSVAAGVGHGLVAPEHLREWWGYGLFFALAAVGQVFFGALLLAAPWRYDDTGGLVSAAAATRPERALCVIGIAGNAAVILLYVVTRTVGVPFLGPAAGEVEPLGPGGVVTTVFETALVGVLVALWRSPAADEAG
ncbi:MAG: hypothetical protein M3357_20310 [Actinomycetota bacterium]|nr:hypothetical protein [Actinomycetota bacterium]